jgi:hypothetical protein
VPTRQFLIWLNKQTKGQVCMMPPSASTTAALPPAAVLTDQPAAKPALTSAAVSASVCREAFIIRELDDTHLLVKDNYVDFVVQQVKAFNNKNVYTPPVDQQ